MIQICQDFGWSYQDYMNTPVWVINLIIEKMKVDNFNIKKQQRKHGRK